MRPPKSVSQLNPLRRNPADFGFATDEPQRHLFPHGHCEHPSERYERHCEWGSVRESRKVESKKFDSSPFGEHRDSAVTREIQVMRLWITQVFDLWSAIDHQPRWRMMDANLKCASFKALVLFNFHNSVQKTSPFFIKNCLRVLICRPKHPLTGGAEALVGTPDGADDGVERRKRKQGLV